MADGDNYVAGVNAARQRARGAIRSRIDQIIDPMQSAAEMDRLQGASVIQTTGQVDPGVNNVFRLAGGGGGSAPVRTAVGGGKAPVQATGGRVRDWVRGVTGGGQAAVSQPTQTTGQCRMVDGRWQCPGSSSVVSQAPMSSTVVSSAPVTTTVMPQSSGPVEYATDSDSLIQRAVQLGSEATGYGLGPAAQAGRAANEAARLGTLGMEQKHLDQRSAEFAHSKQLDEKYKGPAILANTALDLAMAGATNDTSSLGRFDNRQKMAREVFEGRANHNWYIDSVVSQYAASAGVQDKSQSRDRRLTPRPAVDTGLTPEQIRQEASREIFTGSIMYDLIRSNNGLRTIADTPNATLDTDVSQPENDPIKLRRSLGGMASAYAERGGFDGDFSAVQLRLMNDLRTLHGSLSTYFLDERRNNPDYATLSASQRALEDETAIQRGRDAAIAIQGAAMDQMKAWHGQYQRGTFNRNDPWAERTTGNAVGGVFPSVEFWTGRTVDSNNTLPPPKKAPPPDAEAKST